MVKGRVLNNMSNNNLITQRYLQQLEEQIASVEAELSQQLKAMKNKYEGEWCELLPNSEALSDFIVNNTEIIEQFAELIVIKGVLKLARRLETPSPLN
jgi:predicted glycosyl hydrolase (DUF1957 family)